MAGEMIEKAEETWAAGPRLARSSGLVLMALVLFCPSAQADDCPRAFGRHIEQGNDHFRAGDHAKAIQSYQAARAACPGDPEPLLGLAFAHHELKQCAESLAAFAEHKTGCTAINRCEMLPYMVKRAARVEQDCRIPVEIHSTPPGAEVRVGQAIVGTTPIRTSWLPGTRTLRATLSGHQSAETTAEARFAGPPVKVQITLGQQPATLRVQAPESLDLSALRLTLDDQPVQGSGLMEISPGPHTLAARWPDGTPWSTAIEARPGEALVIPLPTGELQVDRPQPGMRFKIGEAPEIALPQTPMPVAPGTHQITVTRADGSTWQTRTQITDGGRTTLTVPEPGSALPWITLSAGGLALGVSLWAGLSAADARSEADDLPAHETERYDTLSDEFDADMRVMWISLGVGAVLVGTGVWLAWPEESEAPEGGVTLTPNGVQVRW